MPRDRLMGRRRDEDLVRYAVIGLGHIAQTAVLPAFARAERSRLALLVSGDATKRQALSDRYGVPAVDEDQLEEAFDREGVEAVYVATPNHLHRKHTVRAARAGRHVLCEKPMAPTEADCVAMHEACERAGVQLMIAYRLHFDPLTLEAVRIAQEELGPLRTFSSTFSMTVEAPDIRLGPTSKGGGPLFDIGVYCINAARMMFRSDPTRVWGMAVRTGTKRFVDADTSVAAVLEFPGDRVATFNVSFDGQRTDEVHVVGRDGHLRLSPAFGHSEELRLLVERGERRPRETVQRVHDQFGPQIDAFSACVRDGSEPEPDWREGLADVRIVEALHRSAAAGGKPVEIGPLPRGPRPKPSQGVSRRPAIPPEEVHAAAPSEPPAPR